MKAIAIYKINRIYRIFAITIMFVATSSYVSAQHHSKTTKKQNNHSVHTQPSQSHDGYKYNNYNYISDAKHNYGQHAIVMNNRTFRSNGHVNQQYRKPYYRKPILNVPSPKQFMSLHLNGHQYYVNDGRFYFRTNHQGMVRVERPRNIKTLPAGAVKVRVNGKFYFRYHSMFFEWTPYGYRII